MTFLCPLYASQVDNIILVMDNWLRQEIEWAIEHYRKNLNNHALVVKIYLGQ